MNKTADKYIDIDGLRIHYLDEGRGEAILLLPGWSRLLVDYKNVVRVLSNNHRVIVPALPGVSKYIHLPRIWGYNDIIGITKKFIEHFNLKDITAIGHSFGGAIALGLSREIEGRIKKLILVNSAGLKVRRSFWGWLWRWYKRRVKGLLSFKSEMLNLHFIYLFFAHFNDLKKSSRIVVSLDLRKDLPSFKTKTLILWGEKDDYFPVENAKILAQGLPNAELFFLKGFSHD